VVDQRLRVADFGRVSPLRSQTLWHALAYGVSRGGPPTLSFMRPSRPYVGVGYHHRLDEADLDACREAGLPVYRRMVGGGVVYLDEHQQFFQICLPLAAVPTGRALALRRLLEPAVAAFRAAGVPATLDDDLEIIVGEAEVCGHGAAQIDDAVVVVGNLIERFDHEAAARVLALPQEVRSEVVRLMRRYVTATPADAAAFRAAAVEAYAETLGLEPVPGGLTVYERQRLTELDRRFTSAEWLRGPGRPEPPCAQIKVRAGVWVVSAGHEQARAVASVIDGRIEHAWVSDPDLDAGAGAVEAGLAGVALGEVTTVLDDYGEPGRRLAAAFAKARPVG
jgi:lipoate---protein ligase